jgi:hypothetical protein
MTGAPNAYTVLTRRRFLRIMGALVVVECLAGLAELAGGRAIWAVLSVGGAVAIATLALVHVWRYPICPACGRVTYRGVPHHCNQ